MNKSVAAAALIFGLLSVSAVAEPQGGQVRAGSATIQQTPGTTTVQQLTDRAIIDWRRFSIDRNELVRFVQPNEMAVILNRVTGGDPSVILGKLQANGQLFLVNPNGILFGPGSQVDVGSLVATTLQISDEGFLSGNYHFVQDSNLDLASVVNQGTITVSDEGYVVLTAPLVSNEGLIVANLGKVALGAGNEVTLNLDGRNLVNFQVSTGQHEGTVVLTPEAVSSVLQHAVGGVSASQMIEENGQVKLVGGEGALVQAGTIQGGRDIQILGTNVAATGTVQAQDGGNIVVWGAENTSMAGTLQANGGTVETSGRYLRLTGAVHAPGGSLLIDPETVRIVSAADQPNDIESSFIVGQLESGTNVTIDAAITTGSEDSDIVQLADAPIIVTLANPVSLTLISGAQGGITLNAEITTNFGEGLDLSLESGTRGATALASIETRGGSFTATGPGDLTLSNAHAETVTITHGGAVALDDLAANTTLSVTGGSIDEFPDADGTTDVFAQGISLSATSGGIGQINGALELATPNAATLSSAGSLSVVGINGLTVTSATTIDGNIDLTTNTTLTVYEAQAGGSGNITLTATGGSVIVGHAEALANQVSLSAGALIEEALDDAAGDVVGGTLTLTAGAGIGTVATLEVVGGTNVSADTLTGAINLASPLDAMVVDAHTGNGNISLVASALTATTVATENGSVSLQSTGNLVLDSVTATGTITATSASSIVASGPDPGSELTSGTGLVLTAGAGLGALDADVLDLSATADGSIVLRNQGGALAVSTLSSDFGEILLSTDGDLTVGSLTAPLDINVSAAGNVTVGLLSGYGVTLTTTGTLDESGADGSDDILGHTVTLSASQIGLTSVPEVFGNASLSATSTASGGTLALQSISGLPFPLSLTTNNGTIAVSQGADSVSLSASGLVVNRPSGDLYLTNTGGNLLVASVAASGTVALTTPAGAIDEFGTDGAADITAGSIVLTAQAGIGQVSALELGATSVATSVTNTDAGTTYSLTTAPDVLSVSTTGGDVSITGSGETVSYVSQELTGTVDVDSFSFSEHVGTLGLADFTAAGNVSLLNTTGNIEEAGFDPQIDLSAAGTLTMSALTGLGGLNRPELEVGTRLEASTDNGFVSLNVAALTPEVTYVLTSLNGGVAVDHAGGRAVLEHFEGLDFNQFESGGEVLVQDMRIHGSGTMDLNVNGGDLTIESLTAEGGQVKIRGNTQVIGSGSGVKISNPTGELVLYNSFGTDGSLEIDASSLEIQVLGVGDVTLHDAGNGLDLTSVVVNHGSLDVSTADGMTVDSVTVAGVNTLKLSAASIAQYVDDPEADLEARTIDLTATGSISLLQTSVGVGGLTATAGTDLSLVNLGNLVLTSVSTTNGNVSLGVDGADFNAQNITVGGAGKGLTLATTTSGDVVLGTGIAAVSGAVVIDSVEAITQTGTSLAGGSLALTAQTGIGALQTATNVLTADTVAGDLIVTNTASGPSTVSLQVETGTGDITFAQAAQHVDLTVQAALGDASLTTADVKLAGGAGGSVGLTNEAAGGSIEVGALSANTVTLTTDGQISGPTSALAGTLSLDAGTGIDLKIASSSVVATTAAGGIHLVDDGASACVVTLSAPGALFYDKQLANLDVTSAVVSGTGSVTLHAGGDLTAGTVTALGAGQDVTLTAAGSVLLSNVSAPDQIAVTAGAAITESGLDAAADLTAAGVTLAAGTGISLLELDGATLAATTTSGGINLTSVPTGAVTVTNLAGGGQLVFSQSGGKLLTVQAANASSDLLAILNDGADLTVGTTQSTGSTQLTVLGSGNLYVGNVRSNTQVSVGVASGTLEESAPDPGIDLMAPTLSLSANAIGQLDRLELASQLLTATTSGAGVNVSNTSASAATVMVTAKNAVSLTQNGGGALAVNVFTTTGAITLVNNGLITATDVRTNSSTSDVTLTTSGANSDILVGVVLGRDITVTTPGRLLEAAPLDASVDLGGRNLVLNAQKGIGTTDTLEIESLGSVTASAGSTGAIKLAAPLGPLTLNSVSTSNGSITISGTGDLTATLVTAGGAGSDVTLSAALILVDSVTAADAIALTATGGLVESTSDPVADLTGASIVLDGGFISLQTATPSLTATARQATASTLANAPASASTVQLHSQIDMTYAQTGGQSLNLLDADTVNGHLTVTTGGALTATDVEAGGSGFVSLTSAGDMLVGRVVAAGDTVVLRPSGALNELGSDASLDIAGALVDLRGPNGIGSLGAIEVNVTGSLIAQVSGAGALNLADIGGGLSATNVTTTTGNLTLSATGGDLDAQLVTSGGGNLALTTVGSGNVHANQVSTTGDVSVVSAGLLDSGMISPGVTGNQVNLTAAGSIALFLSSNTVQATAVGIDLLENGGLDVLSANAGTGDLTLTSVGGTLSVGTASGRIVTLTGSNGAGVLVNDVSATVSLSVTGGSLEELGVDPTADLTAPRLTLATQSGIGQLATVETSTPRVQTATVNGTGRIALRNVGALEVVSATTANGAIAIASDAGDLLADSLSAGGSGSNVTLTTTTSGNIRVGDVQAVGDFVIITAVGAIEETTPDNPADVTGSTVRLTAGTGIGVANRLEVDATTLTPVVTGPGAISVADMAGGVTVTGASTADGAIQLLAVSGSLTATSLTAGGTGRNVVLTASNGGSVLLGSVVALDDNITVSATGGSINELGSDAAEDLSANNLNLASALGVGNLGALEVKTAVLTASTLSAGANIAVSDLTATLTAASVTSAGGVDLSAMGTLTLTSVTAGNNGVTATSTSKVVVGSVDSAGSVALTAGTSIEEDGDAGVDITAPTSRITLQAVTGIGAVDALETDGLLWNAHVTGVGAIRLTDAAGTSITAEDVDTASGDIVLVARNQQLVAQDVQATGGFANLTSQTSGDLKLGLVSATGAVNLTAAGGVDELGSDAADDLVAGANSTIRALGGGIGLSSNAPEVRVTNATLGVSATTQSAGISVLLAGIVSPTNTLIKLNAPPGLVFFNGVLVP